VLLVHHGNAAKTAGKIGIATTAYSAARGQLIATGMPDVYLAGYGAMTCILAEGPMFNGKSASDRNNDFQTEIARLETRINVVNGLRNHQLDPKKVKGQADALKTAYALADQIVTAARTAEAAALKQQAAWNSAPGTFQSAVSSVSVAVASKGRVRPAVEFGALRDSMLPPKEPATTDNKTEMDVLVKTFGRPPPDDPKLLIEKLLEKANELTTQTAQLSAATPDYLKSLSNVQDCPKEIH
jgi:hypothetical protein